MPWVVSDYCFLGLYLSSETVARCLMLLCFVYLPSTDFVSSLFPGSVIVK